MQKVQLKNLVSTSASHLQLQEIKMHQNLYIQMTFHLNNPEIELTSTNNLTYISE